MRVEVHDVTYSVPGRQLFSRLTHTFAGTATVAIMGPSGSGKSTLLGLVSGQLTPQSGLVRICADGDGQLKPLIPAWIFQSSPLLSQRTALDNAMTASLMAGHDPEESRLRAREALHCLGLGELRAARVSGLSGGERQRVAVARAITARSSLILADEPTASLDPDARRKVIEALKHASELGALTLIATHDPWVAQQCDDRFWIEEGQLVGDEKRRLG
jgi:ABC-type lipoprotein export system ATPase subunit